MADSELEIANHRLRDSEERLKTALAGADAERDRVRLLLDVTNTLASELNLKDLLKGLSKLLRETIPHHFVSVTLWDDKAQAMRRHALVFPAGHGLIKEGEPLRGHSPAALAFERGETMVFRWRDIETIGGRVENIMAVEGLRSVCCVPLKTARRSYGTLNVGKPEDEAFPADEILLLQQISSQLGMAIENALHFQQAEEYRRQAADQRDQLKLLLQVTNAVVSQREPHALRQSVLAAIRDALGHNYASLAIYDPEANLLRIEANTFRDHRGVMEPQHVAPLGGSPAGVVFVEKVTRVFSRKEMEQFHVAGLAPLLDAGMQCVCCVPLQTQRGVLGTLNVASRDPDAFAEADVRWLGEIAGQIAIAVENTLAFQEIRTLRDRLNEERLYLEDEITRHHEFNEIIGQSKALNAVLDQVRTVAPTDATVLLLGETGTGKELLARAIHELSRRSSATFVRVNSAALPMGLIESELFGYEKGAFTGAVVAKIGRLELAHRGTLFLDEVGDLPLETQPKLLRALQEREFERLGSTRTLQVDVRLITATNRELDEMVANGAFRSDLYYRLSVFPIRLPPLRERPEDIPFLVRHFARAFSRELGKNIETIPASTIETLQRWTWPGNIRELQNVIERAVILSKGPVLNVPLTALQVAPTPVSEAPPRTGRRASTTRYADGERALILQALRDANGTIGGSQGAAARLGLKRTTLQSKIRKLGIKRPLY